MQKFLRLNATTKNERHCVIESVKDAIAASNGWILDFKLFSNLSATINFELPPQKLMTFPDVLRKIGLRLNETGLQAIHDLTDQQTAPAEISATLQITFIHDEPDLRISVPMIPG